MSTTPDAGTDRLRFALVGAGVIGTHHGKVITELAGQIELVGVVDHHLDRADRLADDRGSSSKGLNEVERYRPQASGGATTGRVPGQLSDAHRYQYENFLDALRGQAEYRVGLAENRQSIGLIVGAYESARTGRAVTLS